jgi:predicted aminopeptidase
MLRAIHTAYDDALAVVQERQGCDRWLMQDWIHKTLARHIVEQARQGECDVVRLRLNALNAIHLDS